MNVLAHRGWWTRPDERNSRVAFQRALDAGFGIETDLRFAGGRIVLSHDHPTGGEVGLDELARMVAAVSTQPFLALNVKEDGLQPALAGLLPALRNARPFLFDMSVPDALASIGGRLPCWTRHSDVEPDPVLYDRSDGVWLDGFCAEWWGEDTVRRHVDNGKSVCLVSPELHGRPHRDTWRTWAWWAVLGAAEVMVCTDFPDEAMEAFR